MATEVYPQSAFVSSGGKIAADALQAEVGAALQVPAPQLAAVPLITLSATGPAEIVCQLDFDAPLSAPQKSTLDGVIAAHLGLFLPIMDSVVSLIPLAHAVASDASFEDLGSVTLSPSSAADVQRVSVSPGGQFRTTGSGAELRLMQKTTSGTSSIGSLVLPDTAGAWQDFQFNSTPPAAGANIYALEGRRNGATSFEVSGVALTLWELDQ